MTKSFPQVLQLTVGDEASIIAVLKAVDEEIER
jgi:hypothetical protein